MKPQLPAHPDLALLRKHAKELAAAARAGDPVAVARCRATVPRLAALDDAGLAAAVRLADAQHALARELGFSSWPKLKREVEGQEPLAAQAERFLAALRGRDLVSAGRLLERFPAIERSGFETACVFGAADRVAAALAADPALATSRSPEGWTPLLYLCASPFHRLHPSIAAGMLRSAELLLAGGADPNEASTKVEGDPETGLPALFYACVNDHAAVVRLLLERGADPNDGESIYHAAERDHRACLELLAAHGGDLSGRHPQWNNTPLYFLAGYKDFHPLCAPATAGMRWLLEHGADPDVTSYASAEAPLHRIAAYGRGAEVAAMLLDHGATVDLPRADGRTAYALALRTGNAAVADLLRQRGADAGRTTAVDRLLGACMTADAAAARALLAGHPGLLAELTAEDRQALALAAEEGREASVRLMVELGFDLAGEGAWGGTPLHHAAWHGRLPMVRLLLSLGAPVNVRDREYGSSPLAWAAHGSTHCRAGVDDDYCAVVDALLAAGADRETAVNRWGEPAERLASRRVAARLRERGKAETGSAPAV